MGFEGLSDGRGSLDWGVQVCQLWLKPCLGYRSPEERMWSKKWVLRCPCLGVGGSGRASQKGVRSTKEVGGEGHVAPAWEGVSVRHRFHHVQQAGTHGALWTEVHGSHRPHCGWGTLREVGELGGTHGTLWTEAHGSHRLHCGWGTLGEVGEPGGTHGWRRH